MSQKSYIVITNNPLVIKKLSQEHNIDFEELTYEELLKKVRDRIHEGHRLLTHPLSGSVKPNETPYKSILITNKPDAETDTRSLQLIENAIQACGKFKFKSEEYDDQTFRDFQMIDWMLLDSGLASADAW